MSMKLVARKRLTYPRGPGGKEYQRGDVFEVLSERDKKALLLVRAAQEEPMPPLRVADPTPVRRTTAALRPEDGTEERPKRTYRRRDMTAEDQS